MEFGFKCMKWQNVFNPMLEKQEYGGTTTQIGIRGKIVIFSSRNHSSLFVSIKLWESTTDIWIIYALQMVCQETCHFEMHIEYDQHSWTHSVVCSTQMYCDWSNNWITNTEQNNIFVHIWISQELENTRWFRCWYNARMHIWDWMVVPRMKLVKI